MALYTFYPCKDDGSSSTFETYDLEDDVDASAKAMVILEQHLSCCYVNVWCGERYVAKRQRIDPALAALISQRRVRGSGAES